MRICFLLSAFSRSGGVNAVLQHSRWLHEDHGHDITLAVQASELPVDDLGAGDFAEIVLLSELPPEREFDLAIATYWETAFWVYDIRARKHLHFLQSLEDRFFPARTPKRTLARISLGLPLPVVTEATWIADVMRSAQPSKPVELVHNGIDKDVFALVESLPAAHGGPLRILVEGHPKVWFKSIPETMEVLDHVSEPFEALFVVPNPDEFSEKLGGPCRAEGPLSAEELSDRYEWADVILKLSRVEGMFGPPLEAFHRGATCVVWPVTGHDEYIRHGENGIVTDWDDVLGTARWLDTLARDRELLRRLQTASHETARAWPSWREAAVEMNRALSAMATSEDRTDAAELAATCESIRASIGAFDRYASAMGLMDGGWPAAQLRVRELESEVERMGGRKRERAKRFAKRMYRRARPIPVHPGPT